MVAQCSLQRGLGTEDTSICSGGAITCCGVHTCKGCRLSSYLANLRFPAVYSADLYKIFWHLLLSTQQMENFHSLYRIKQKSPLVILMCYLSHRKELTILPHKANGSGQVSFLTGTSPMYGLYVGLAFTFFIMCTLADFAFR